MTQQLNDFIESGTKLIEDTVSMGPLPLHVTCYLSTELPPAKYVTSVRAIVFQDNSVLVVTQPDGRMTILPGGQVEQGETLEKTLQRELLEETGWVLSNTSFLGFIHLHHLGLKPENFKYLYPDFIWSIYTAEAERYLPEKMKYDEYVSESSFQPFDDIKNLPIDKGQLLLLESALKKRNS